MVKNVMSNVVTSHMAGEYITPAVKVVLFQPEGVLCSSGLTEQFNENDYSDGSFWN